jgi:hypothetical protein
VAAAGLLVLATSPLAAFTLVERGSSFKTRVTLPQAATFTGGGKLAPGTYDVNVVSMGDGSVRASFFDLNGKKLGEERGIIAIIKSPEAAPAQGGGGTQGIIIQGGRQASDPQGVIIQGGRQAGAPATFASLSLTRESPTRFEVQGNKLNLQIGAPGGNQILIGLLVPAVQKVRQAAVPPAGAQLPGGAPMKK